MCIPKFDNMPIRLEKGFCYIPLLMLMVFSLSGLSAQNRGGIKGVLKDASTGEPMMYANVALMGTTFGTVTDDGGNYELLNHCYPTKFSSW